MRTKKGYKKSFPDIPGNELKLRKLLWLHHGCPSQYFYGDDGEFQCHNQKHDFLGIDFRRDSVDLIEWKLGNQWHKGMIPRPKE
jgi:hypothetical protein